MDAATHRRGRARDRRRAPARSRPTCGATPRRATSAAGRSRARSSCSSSSRAPSGTPGGTAPNAYNKAIPAPPMMPPPAQGVERAPDAEGVPARVLRDELPAPALPEGGPRQARDVLHARLQPRVDEPRRHVVDRDADGREQGRAARLSDADLERDGVVRRLRAADGPRLRASRPDVAGDARGALDRLPPAGAAPGAGAPGQDLRLHVAGARGRRHRPGVGRGRVLDRALVAHRPRRRARHPQVLRVAVPPRREAPHRGVLPVDLREQRARPPAGRGDGRASRRSSTCASTARS